MLTTATALPRFPSSLKSPLDGVPLHAWRSFVAALEVQPMGALSSRGGFGSYDLRPQRLEDLGLVVLRAVKRRGEARHYVCTFVAPMTQERFLSDPLAQLDALSRSMRSYQEDLRTGRLVQPAGLSLAGTLALLHCGPGALAAFPDGLFPHTRTVLERAQGAF